ncbi:MAG: ComEA family DNA-binding protein [Candidatus Cloacimonetes bacterium]|nr:ComEA family DNA-binding protein [Candidatus Cloacimonadota bacterium]
MKKLNDFLTSDEQKLLLFIAFFAFVGLIINFTGLIAENDAQAADSLNFQQDHQIKYDLQNATKEELMTIPGIGEKTAANILSYRSEFGFRNNEDLMKVKGIGEKTYAKIKKYLIGSTTSHSETASNQESKRTSDSVIKVNINTADKNELTKIKGIGPSKAEKIIALRSKIGEFKEINELLKVKGIGKKTLEKISEQISLGE